MLSIDSIIGLVFVGSDSEGTVLFIAPFKRGMVQAKSTVEITMLNTRLANQKQSNTTTDVFNFPYKVAKSWLKQTCTYETPVHMSISFRPRQTNAEANFHI